MRKLLIHFSLTLVLTIITCSANAIQSQPLQSTDEAVRQYAQAIITDLDHGYYQRTWNQASPLLKGTMPADIFAQAIKHERRKLGKVQKRSLIDSQQHLSHGASVPEGKYMNVRFSTTFKRHQLTVNEQLSFYYGADHTWRLLGYKIID